MYSNCFGDAAEQESGDRAVSVRAEDNKVSSPSFGVFDNTAASMALNDGRRGIKTTRGESSGSALYKGLSRLRGSLDERRHGNKAARFNHAEKVHYSVFGPGPGRNFAHCIVRPD
jgi:hypothetical protein